MKKRIRGVIVWDFDGVLFDTKQFRLDNQSVLCARGVSKKTIREIMLGIRKSKKHFSISEFMRRLRKTQYRFSEKSVRSIFHRHLARRRYYPFGTDRLLHRMRKWGFVQMIVSLGSAPFQYKKMTVGCGSVFLRHFARVIVTQKPKYVAIAQLKRMFPGSTMIFIDDTKRNLRLAKRHIPDIIPLHYSYGSGRSVQYLEKDILRHAP